MRIGYARVSTDEQDLALQRQALSEFGCERIFEDHGASGADAARPGLEDALSAADAGDTLVVWRLDRLGRSLGHLIDIVDQLGRSEIGLSATDGAETSLQKPGESKTMPPTASQHRPLAESDPGDACGTDST